MTTVSPLDLHPPEVLSRSWRSISNESSGGMSPGWRRFPSCTATAASSTTTSWPRPMQYNGPPELDRILPRRDGPPQGRAGRGTPAPHPGPHAPGQRPRTADHRLRHPRRPGPSSWPGPSCSSRSTTTPKTPIPNRRPRPTAAASRCCSKDMPRRGGSSAACGRRSSTSRAWWPPSRTWSTTPARSTARRSSSTARPSSAASPRSSRTPSTASPRKDWPTPASTAKARRCGSASSSGATACASKSAIGASASIPARWRRTASACRASASGRGCWAASAASAARGRDHGRRRPAVGRRRIGACRIAVPANALPRQGGADQ